MSEWCRCVRASSERYSYTQVRLNMDAWGLAGCWSGQNSDLEVKVPGHGQNVIHNRVGLCNPLQR